MTLIVTEVSESGIAMLADSMISYQNPDGSVSYQKRWKKLFKVDVTWPRRTESVAVRVWGR